MPRGWNAYEWTPARHKRLMALIEREGFTQAEAARAMGISRGTVERYLSSKQKIPA